MIALRTARPGPSAMVCFGSDTKTKARSFPKTTWSHSQVLTFPFCTKILLKLLYCFALKTTCSLNYPGSSASPWYPLPASDTPRQDTAALQLIVATYRLIGSYIWVGWLEGGCQPWCVMAKFSFSFWSGSLPPVRVLIFMQLAGI